MTPRPRGRGGHFLDAHPCKVPRHSLDQAEDIGVFDRTLKTSGSQSETDQPAKLALRELLTAIKDTAVVIRSNDTMTFAAVGKGSTHSLTSFVLTIVATK